MLNPCIDCPRSKARDEYLEFILPSFPKPRMPEDGKEKPQSGIKPAKILNKDGTLKKPPKDIKASQLRKKTVKGIKHQKKKCKMIGCKTKVEGSLYCHHCQEARMQAVALGQKPPVRLSDKRIEHQKNRKVKLTERNA